MIGCFLNPPRLESISDCRHSDLRSNPNLEWALTFTYTVKFQPPEPHWPGQEALFSYPRLKVSLLSLSFSPLIPLFLLPHFPGGLDHFKNIIRVIFKLHFSISLKSRRKLFLYILCFKIKYVRKNNKLIIYH